MYIIEPCRCRERSYRQKKRMSLLSKFKESLRQYMHIPWDTKAKKSLSIKEYTREADGYLGCRRNHKKKDCQTWFPNAHQVHGGNVFEHTVWALLTIDKWVLDGNVLLDGVDVATARMAALLHDIGKAGDCISTCKDGACVYDVYNPDRYPVGKDDTYHTLMSGDIIMGKRPFFLTCIENREDREQLDVTRLIGSVCDKCKVSEVALVAYMHWAFGKLNMIDDIPPEKKMQEYYELFVAACAETDSVPSLDLVKLCIAVSAADIAAGTDVRVRDMADHQYEIYASPSPVYLSRDPWVQFGMDRRVYLLRHNLITFMGAKLQLKR
jgi:CRISPR/Cas system-associated endonuclease Cas3-HD